MKAPRVSVVIPHYFTVRAPHLRRIAADLQRGTVTPHEVVVWNNDAAAALPDLTGTGIRVLQAAENKGAQARIKAALTVTGDYVLFLDNDTTVEPDTLANLVRWAQATPRHLVTLEGRTCPSPTTPYRHWPKAYGRRVSAPQRVTMSLGRGELVPRFLVPAMAAYFPFGPDGTMDDLWWSACAAQVDAAITVVPCQLERSGLVNLPVYGTGASKAVGYYAARDAAIAAIRAQGVWN